MIRSSLEWNTSTHGEIIPPVMMLQYYLRGLTRYYTRYTLVTNAKEYISIRILKSNINVVYDIWYLVSYTNYYWVYYSNIHYIFNNLLDSACTGFYQKSVHSVKIRSKSVLDFHWGLYWIIGRFFLNIKSSRFYPKFTRFPCLGYW